MVSAYAHVTAWPVVCDMYVTPPPILEHAKLSVVARCWPASVVEQPMEKAPLVKDCEPSAKPLAHAAVGVYAFQPAYAPAEMAGLAGAICCTLAKGHTSKPVASASL